MACSTTERAVRAWCDDDAVRRGVHDELDPGLGYGGELMGYAGEIQKGFIIFCI
jgi:hypothetical protein